MCKMAAGIWELLLVLLCTRTRSSYAEFTQLLPRQSEAWTAYYSLNPNDCSVSGKHQRFPNVYGLENDSEISLGCPANLTMAYLLRPYRRYRRDNLFPGILVEFDKPEYGSEYLRGYEILLTKANGIVCIVLELVENPPVHEDKVKVVLYPLSSNMYFRVQTATLPLYTETQKTEEQRIMTGNHGRLPAPVSWVATTVTYEVIRQADERWLDVIFSSPPPQFRFRRFEVALLPADNRENGIRIVTTETCYYTFRNVTLGQYKLQIRPVDDYFSIQGRCLCHYRGGTCSTCLTTEVEAITVS